MGHYHLNHYWTGSTFSNLQQSTCSSRYILGAILNRCLTEVKSKRVFSGKKFYIAGDLCTADNSGMEAGLCE